MENTRQVISEAKVLKGLVNGASSFRCIRDNILFLAKVLKRIGDCVTIILVYQRQYLVPDRWIFVLIGQSWALYIPLKRVRPLKT